MKIADRIKPIGLDSVGFLKNFRGEVTIDLKDVKTGEVETYHDHNLVTKALGYFLKQGGLSNPSAFNASALRTDFIHYMLGGMMCLDTAITDDGGHDDEIVRVPAGVGMTANGAYNVVNTGNPPELGSWNELESGWQNDGSYKMVWDFTTSQGNGTIATVCLTSLFSGYEGLGNKSNTRKTTSIVGFNAYNSYFSKGIGAGRVIGYKDNVVWVSQLDYKEKTQVSISKYKFPTTDWDIRNVQSAELIETLTVNLPVNLQNITFSGDVLLSEVYIVGSNGYILVTGGGGYDNRRQGKGYIATFNVESETFTESYVVDLTSVSERVNITGITDTYVVLGLKWYNYRNQALNGDITDGAELYDNSSSHAHTYLETIDTDRLIGGGGIIDISTSKWLANNGTGEELSIGGYLTGNNLLKVSGIDDGAIISRDPRYIATIFNLDSAKTKSADKTMKVTYVLRFNEEEGE